ncbi:hypothetical protein D3C81_2175680 [compost metagenome]
MAFLLTGSPIRVQLHCKGPTGKVSRIRAVDWVIGQLRYGGARCGAREWLHGLER